MSTIQHTQAKNEFSETTAELTFEDEGSLSAMELADFIHLFALAYGTAAPTVEEIAADIERTREAYLSHWERIPGGALLGVKRRFDDTFMGTFDLEHQKGIHRYPQIIAINKNSPLLIIFGGVAIALALAAILSGGQIEVSPGKIKCKLPPLGKGIEALRNALRKKTG